MRQLIRDDAIPDNVTVQVLTQARSHLIERTFAALDGVDRAIVHVYNSTSALQRDVVFGVSREQVKAIAVAGARDCLEASLLLAGADIRFEYSPESFTSTESDFAVEVCEAVTDVFAPTVDRPLIINCPATVEVDTPNVFADRVELMGRSLTRREATVLSVHPHNDRGTATAAAELALLAGADRVEGCLFGNGERTGNVCLVTLAGNLLSHGIDPGWDVSDLAAVRETVECVTGMEVPPRHPYGGELVFTAFSGSHQDAINKGLKALSARAAAAGVPLADWPWQVPYLPIDPVDVGRDYEAVVRVNSQSGKGGVAYVMRTEHGFDLPKGVQGEFAAVVQAASESSGGEVSSVQMLELFEAEFVSPAQPWLVLDDVRSFDVGHRQVSVVVDAVVDGVPVRLSGSGNGPVAALCAGLSQAGVPVAVSEFVEHALGPGTEAAAVAYVCAQSSSGPSWGVGVDGSIVGAGFAALLSALNRHPRPS